LKATEHDKYENIAGDPFDWASLWAEMEMHITAHAARLSATQYLHQ
jgi:hypothetical protein